MIPVQDLLDLEKMQASEGAALSTTAGSRITPVHPYGRILNIRNS